MRGLARYKIFAESFRGAAHLRDLLREAQAHRRRAFAESRAQRASQRSTSALILGVTVAAQYASAAILIAPACAGDA